MPHGSTTLAEGFTYIDGETARQMRRPGTLPASSGHHHRSSGIGVGGNAGSCGPGGMSVEESSSSLNGTGVDDRALAGSGSTVPGASGSGNNGTTGSGRSHYSNLSLRRTPQPPQLPSRGNDCIDRMHGESRIQNGIPGHHPPPPPLPSRHQSTCSQSSYPTLPVNGHGAHHYHHYPRERDKDRSSTRERNNRERDGGGGGGGGGLRGEKHREAQLEMELHDGIDVPGIGTYRA